MQHKHILESLRPRFWCILRLSMNNQISTCLVVLTYFKMKSKFHSIEINEPNKKFNNVNNNDCRKFNTHALVYQVHAELDTPDVHVFNRHTDKIIRDNMKQTFTYFHTFPFSILLIDYSCYILQLFTSIFFTYPVTHFRHLRCFMPISHT